MQDKALVDTCILAYLVDKTEPIKHEKAQTWFESIRKEKQRYFISMQNLRELANVSLKKTTLFPREINENNLLFSETFGVLWDETGDIITAVLLAETDRKNFWDCLLAATAKRHGIRTILTENTKDFGRIKGIKAKNPLA